MISSVLRQKNALKVSGMATLSNAGQTLDLDGSIVVIATEPLCKVLTDERTAQVLLDSGIHTVIVSANIDDLDRFNLEDFKVAVFDDESGLVTLHKAGDLKVVLTFQIPHLGQYAFAPDSSNLEQSFLRLMDRLSPQGKVATKNALKAAISRLSKNAERGMSEVKEYRKEIVHQVEMVKRLSALTQETE